MKERLYVVFFTLAVTAVFATLVSGVNAVFMEKKLENQNVARQRVILQLLGFDDIAMAQDNETVIRNFERKVETIIASDSKGNDLEFYTALSLEKPLLVFPFKGRGFWDSIYGFIALNPRDKTIAGIEFTLHGETPGLGGRISEPSFKSGFKGKSFASKNQSGQRLTFTAEGSSANKSEIDGITGASGTTAALSRIINACLDEFMDIIEGKKQL